ncbi:hypothetical protein PoB_000731400 [Plakobranchus ocellatus]|uniref:Uncharacterized protein n=1 Tax=Plakobranchus ocellatus TaxID=259542 RepID=A0AAV3YEV5_9GAST|nr:hypothetical protein PoB_000731400 [Plakobranchus ocellatus]
MDLYEKSLRLADNLVVDKVSRLSGFSPAWTERSNSESRGWSSRSTSVQLNVRLRYYKRNLKNKNSSMPKQKFHNNSHFQHRVTISHRQVRDRLFFCAAHGLPILISLLGDYCVMFVTVWDI